MATGGCLCGAVRYRVEGPLRPVTACHCGQCLKWHGHFAAYSACANAAITIEGEGDLAWYRSSGFAERGFCRRCGSSLFWRRDDSDQISMTAGSLDQPTGLETVLHIFRETPADYYRLGDGVPEVPASSGDLLAPGAEKY
jgi:hypothetical protein